MNATMQSRLAPVDSKVLRPPVREGSWADAMGSRNQRPGVQCRQGSKSWVPSNRQNWENKYYRLGPDPKGDLSTQSLSLLLQIRPLTFRITSHGV